MNTPHNANQPLGGVIFSCMRSGSTLFAALLNQTGRYHSLGETHVEHWGQPTDVAAAIRHKIEQQLGYPARLPLVDKVCDMGNLCGGEFSTRLLAYRTWILIRHPLAIWKSQVQTGLEYCTIPRLATEMEKLVEIAYWKLPRTQVLSYYDITHDRVLKEMFKIKDRKLAPWETECRSGWGDPYPQDGGRIIRPVVESEDIYQAKRFFTTRFMDSPCMARARRAYELLKGMRDQRLPKLT